MGRGGATLVSFDFAEEATGWISTFSSSRCALATCRSPRSWSRRRRELEAGRRRHDDDDSPASTARWRRWRRRRAGCSRSAVSPRYRRGRGAQIPITSGDPPRGTVLLPQGRGVPGIVFLRSGAEGAGRTASPPASQARGAALIFDSGVGGSSTGGPPVSTSWRATPRRSALRGEKGVRANAVGIRPRRAGRWRIVPKVPDLAFVVASAPSSVPMDALEEYSLGNSLGLPRERRRASRATSSRHRRPRLPRRRDGAGSRLEAVRDRAWAFERRPSDPYWALARHLRLTARRALAPRRAPALLLFGEKAECRRAPAPRSPRPARPAAAR